MNIENLFKEKDYPFLKKQIEEFKNLNKTLSITNNSPLMATAIIKLLKNRESFIQISYNYI